MINLVEGDLFESKSPCLVNTVNCEGIMGKGIAVEFRIRYPKMYLAYRGYCKAGLLMPGECHVWRDRGVTIINAATKRTWRRPSEYEWIHCICRDIDCYCRMSGNMHVAVPALGCSNGGLNWKFVKEIMKRYFETSRVTYDIYKPIA